ncbi:hypothetical protein D3C72_504460 [compost metagenome]
MIIHLILLSIVASYGQNRKGDFALEKGSNAHELYVSFDTSLHFDETSYNTVAQSIPGFKALQQEYGLILEKGIEISDVKLDELEQKAIELTGKGHSVAKLRNILKIKINNPTNDRLLALAKN